MDNTGDDNPSDNNIAGIITLIQIVKMLKINKPDFYYNNRDKLKGWLYQVQVNICFQQDWLKFKADQALYTLAYCRGKAWNFIESAITQFLEQSRDK